MPENKLNKIVILYWVSLVGGIASICALLFSIADLGEGNVKYLALGSIAYIFCLFGIQFYMLLERTGVVHTKDAALERLRNLQAFEDSYENIHAVCHAFRDRMQEIRKQSSKLNQKYIHREFCLLVLDNLRDIFQGITGVRCATSIKMYLKDRDLMLTIGRDCVSSADRSLIDQKRRATITNNTASQRIILNQDRHYFCNDLEEAFDKDEYVNDRSDWQHHYKSVICWPIRYYDPNTEDIDIFGLLCVDSPSKNAFDKKSLQVGACISDLIYNYFVGLETEEFWDEVIKQLPKHESNNFKEKTNS